MTILVRVLSTGWYVDVEVERKSPAAVAEEILAKEPNALVTVTERGNVLVEVY